MIRSEEAKIAWETKHKLPKRIVSSKGNVYTVGLDGKIQNAAGAVIGSLFPDEHEE